MNRLYKLTVVFLVIMLLVTGCSTITPSNTSSDKTTLDQNTAYPSDKEGDNNKDNSNEDSSSMVSDFTGMNSEDSNGEDSNGKDNINEENNSSNQKDKSELQIIFQAEVMENGESLLVTPDPESSEYKSSNKFMVSVSDDRIWDTKGKGISKEDLRPGDMLEITYNGVILESYPAQIFASSIQLLDHNIIIDGYLAIIDDIYQEDEGLNHDIELLTLDTTDWVELTDMEKEIIFSSLEEAYGLEVLEGTFNELVEQGIIDREKGYFEKGVHIIISKMKYDSKAKKFNYSIEKWRSGTGAVGTNDATAKYKGGEWIIEKGMIWMA